LFGAEAEAIAEAYEEEAALTSGPDDFPSLVVRVRKIEERLATIEDYLGTPPAKAGTLEERIEGLEGDHEARELEMAPGQEPGAISFHRKT
jgi:hypothetical protein